MCWAFAFWIDFFQSTSLHQKIASLAVSFEVPIVIRFLFQTKCFVVWFKLFWQFAKVVSLIAQRQGLRNSLLGVATGSKSKQLPHVCPCVCIEILVGEEVCLYNRNCLHFIKVYLDIVWQMFFKLVKSEPLISYRVRKFLPSKVYTESNLHLLCWGYMRIRNIVDWSKYLDTNKLLLNKHWSKIK